MYAPLWCKSNCSFLEGASHPEELVEEVRHLGLRSLALTDRDGLYGIVRAHARARELGIDLIVGSEVTLDDDSTVVLLAIDRAGYGRLCRLISKGRLRHPKGVSRVTFAEVAEAAPGLIALWGGERARCLGEDGGSEVAALWKEAFGDRLHVLLARHQRASDAGRETKLRRVAARWNLPLIAAVEVLYHSPARRPLQDVLTCIRHGVGLSQAGRRLRPNDEHALVNFAGFERRFADVPGAVQRTLEVAERCAFRMERLRYRYPSEVGADGVTSAERLRTLTLEGARLRYPARVPDAVSRQIDKELVLIEELDYGGYFLTMWEIVQFCREHEILCQGRGSAANSAVCFALGITAVDPARIELLFERFLSRERAEPPDIDLDIEHDRREEVIQFVYRRYDREHAAMVANVVRYRPRSAVRDVGKVLGLPVTALDRVARLLGSYGDVTPEALRHGGFDPDAGGAAAHLFQLSREILDFPRHLSIHPGGFLLGQEPVCELVPVENASMEGRTVIQWDKDDVETLGLFKVDLLGLGALTQLHLAFDLLARHRGISLTMATIPAEDPATYEAMGRGDTVGVFQIESRAQMAMLPRLRPRTFYDLVIEISIVRPGPISGGMVHPFLRRRNGEEAVIYPHECLRPVLAKTLGVPLFQEQVMKLAMVAADYTPGEADRLRRDMAAWRKCGRIEKHRTVLIERMTAKGIAVEFAERVLEQIRGFGEYGFPESHAASFALVSYAAAYLKRHYPAEFTCALLNAWPMGFYQPSTILEDARRHGVEVRPVAVESSVWECTLEATATDFAVRIGARFVSGLEHAEWRRVERARQRAPFQDLEDLVTRADLRRAAAVKLAEAGAFAALGGDRRQALWDVRRHAAYRDVAIRGAERGSPATFLALGGAESVVWDYRSMALSSRGHPLEAIREQLRAQGLADARSVTQQPDGSRVRYAGAVICRQRPSTAKGVVFLTLEDETGFVNLVVWSQVFERYAVLLKTLPFLGVQGRLQAKDGTTHLIVEQVFAPSVDWGSVLPESRDFH